MRSTTPTGFPRAAATLALADAMAGLASCGSTGSAEHVPVSAPVVDETPKIRIGMTKSQVIRAWGEPSGKQVTPRGEIWVWGGQHWKRMIPYAGMFLNVQTSKVIFGANGRVKDFRLTDRGDAMSSIEGYSGGFNAW